MHILQTMGKGTQRIIDNLVDIENLYTTGFTELESFLLMSSAWLHDIGMYLGGRAGDTVSDVRVNHADIGADLIPALKERHFQSLSNPEMSLIQQIIQSHSFNYDLDEVPVEPENIDGNQAHALLLCAVFRLADACDCNNSRAPESIFYIYYEEIPEGSKEHWERLFSVTDVIFDKLRSAIVISYDFGNTLRDLLEKYMLSNILKKELERELFSVQRILRENSIPLSRVLIKYFGRDEYLDFTSFNIEQYCLITLNSHFRLFDEIVDIFSRFIRDDGDLPIYLEIRPPEGPLFLDIKEKIHFENVEEITRELEEIMGESFQGIKIERRMLREVS